MNIKLAEKDANGSDGSESNEVSEDASILKQTRVRRVFTETQLFAFNASYMTTWLGVGCSMYCECRHLAIHGCLAVKPPAGDGRTT